MSRTLLHRTFTATLLILTAFATAPIGAAAAAAPPPAVVVGQAEGLTMGVRGAGPYRIGIGRAELERRGLLDQVTPRPGCPGITDAGATGRWAGMILLTFRANRLVDIGTATDAVRSPAGARVGMSFEQLEQIYGRRGTPLRNDAGRQGYVVRHGPLVELFADHPIRPGVGSFSVGRRDFTLRTFLEGC